MPDDDAAKVCESPKMTAEEGKEAISDQLKAMGADQECKQEFDTAYAAASASFSGSVPFASVSGAVSANAGSSSSKNSGCTDIIMNATSSVTRRINMACIINQNKQQSNFTVGANATVKVQVNAKIWHDSFQEALASTQKNIAQLNKLPINNQFEYDMRQNSLKALQTIVQMMGTPPKLKITNSTIKAKANSTVSIVSHLDVANQQKLEDEFKNQAKAATDTALQKTAGLGAQQQKNFKSLVDNKFKTEAQNVTKNVQTSMNMLTVSSQNNGDILITSSSDITIQDTTLDAQAFAQFQSQNLMQAANTFGQKVAADLITEANNTMSSKEQTDGINDLAKTLGDNAANLQKAVNEGAKNNFIPYIIAAIAILILIPILAHTREGVFFYCTK